MYTFATSCNGDCSGRSDVQKRSLVGFVGGIRLTSEEVVVRSGRERDEMTFDFVLTPQHSTDVN